MKAVTKGSGFSSLSTSLPRTSALPTAPFGRAIKRLKTFLVQVEQSKENTAAHKVKPKSQSSAQPGHRRPLANRGMLMLSGPAAGPQSPLDKSGRSTVGLAAAALGETGLLKATDQLLHPLDSKPSFKQSCDQLEREIL